MHPTITFGLRGPDFSMVDKIRDKINSYLFGSSLDLLELGIRFMM